MGQRLVQLIEFAKKCGGMSAQMRLAMKTCVTTGQAGTLPDSAEMVQKFREAVKEVTGQEPPIV